MKHLTSGITLCYAFLFAALSFAQTFDIVLANGRVMDPESGLDAVRSVGIRGGRIAAISATALNGRTVVDAKGLVIAPGFIDMHSHGQDPENYRFKAHDGVTTALELEIGVSPVASWYAERQGKALVNFGASSGHVPVRMAVMRDTGSILPRDEAAHRVPTDEEKLSIFNLVRKGLEEGAIGIGLGIAYVPTAGREEILKLFEMAAESRLPVIVHMRGAIDSDGAIPAVQELIANAAATGASLHIVHITSVGSRKTATCLQLIEGARKRGLDVTTEMYPYTASASRIESAIYDGDWLKRSGASYSDLQWVATGERLTAESFARYRKQGGAIIAHTIPAEALRLGLTNPIVMFASDGRIVEGKGHPRGAGSFARVLGLYVRQEKAITLMDALRRMTIMPAQRLQGAVPAMKNKGRIKIGADADITVFDPNRVIDRATFERPQYSDGIQHVLVAGTLVVRDGKTVEGVFPGVGMRTR